MKNILCGDFNRHKPTPNNNTGLSSEPDIYDFQLLSKLKEYNRETKETILTNDLVFSKINLQTM